MKVKHPFHEALDPSADENSAGSGFSYDSRQCVRPGVYPRPQLWRSDLGMEGLKHGSGGLLLARERDRREGTPTPNSSVTGRKEGSQSLEGAEKLIRVISVIVRKA